jgi:hypothetical protein
MPVLENQNLFVRPGCSISLTLLYFAHSYFVECYLFSSVYCPHIIQTALHAIDLGIPHSSSSYTLFVASFLTLPHCQLFYWTHLHILVLLACKLEILYRTADTTACIMFRFNQRIFAQLTIKLKTKVISSTSITAYQSFLSWRLKTPPPQQMLAMATCQLLRS